MLGCDFVGEVTELGDQVTQFAHGDIVAGLIWGGEPSENCKHPYQLLIKILGETPGLGGYSQYSVADQRISFKVPASISRAEASTVPLAATTAWLALFSRGCLNIDRSQAGTSVLVWGGSCELNLPHDHVMIDVLTITSECRPVYHSTRVNMWSECHHNLQPSEYGPRSFLRS